MPRNSTREPSPISAQAERIDRDLGAIRRILRKRLEAAQARGGLTAPQTAVMSVIVRHDGISLKDLSREVSLAHSTVSGIADRLEKRGMIERRADAGDGRITRICPTAAVTRFVRDKMPALSRRPLESALSRATPAQRAAIEQAIARLRQLLSPS
jgi:DNA-binding MarR family transcriptional regulator